MQQPSLPLNLQKLTVPPFKSSALDSKHWNLIIKRHTKQKNDNAILTTYNQMESLGVMPDTTTLPLILKACTRLQAIERGRRIHRDIENTNLINDVRVQTGLVDFYCKCGCIERARHLFDEMTQRDVVSWNAMISGCVECLEYDEAIKLFMLMQKENLEPSPVTMVALLLAAAELLELKHGKEIHGYCLRHGFFNLNPHVGTTLIGFYLKFNVKMACCVFESMLERNVVSWNTMISGYFDCGDSLRALEIFLQMLMGGTKCDSVTMLVVIGTCAEFGSLNLGQQVHQLSIKFGLNKNLYLVNALLNMYSKLGCPKSSFDLFRSMSTGEVALWNSMISAYVESGHMEKAISLFTKMQAQGIKEEERTVVILLSLCAEMASGLSSGKAFHARVIKSGMETNVPLENSLLSMYVELSCIEDGIRFFNHCSKSDVMLWNTLILALVRNGLKDQAWEYFEQMPELGVKPNSHTIISILYNCECETFLNVGRSIHGHAIKRAIEINTSLNTALTEMYMNCGDEATAWNLFHNYCERDLISWNSMITLLVKNDQADKGLQLFRHMISAVEPNSITIANILSACTHLANLPHGQCLHAYIIRREYTLVSDLALANAFITMYSRCGSLQYAEKFFQSLLKKNIVSWNVMIAAYGTHGRGFDAMLAFSQMVKEGFKPNGATFVSALSACSHSGLIDKGLQLFHSMIQDFYLTPELYHYGCIVDMLGRGGCLNEANELINSMPITPDASIWRALLGACRVYSDTKLAKVIFKRLVELEPMNAGNYVLLSNIYAAAGIWSEVRKLRSVMDMKGLKKPPGKSWIVVKCNVHCFTAGDRSHPQSDKIYAELNYLLSSIKETGYVPDLQCVLHDEEDEEKVKRLYGHSEKLAIAFGLINVCGGAPILITKNLRVCGDCHEFSKHVSMLLQRKIILRDGSRFHHFINGFCSCKDYW